MKLKLFVAAWMCMQLAYAQKPVKSDFKYPKFPRGKDSLQAFVNSHATYPAAALGIGKEGEPAVLATLDEKGQVEETMLYRSTPWGFSQEAIGLVKSMPAWTPAKKKGKAIPSACILPVSFKTANGTGMITITSYACFEMKDLPALLSVMNGEKPKESFPVQFTEIK